MNQGEIKEKIIMLCYEIFRNFGVDVDLIEYVDFVDDLEMDSITFISLVIKIEEEFDIVIPDEVLSIERFSSVVAIVTTIFDIKH